MPKVNATTACLPGMPVKEAVAALHTGLTEPFLGKLHVEHIQLCPQSRGRIDEAMCDFLMETYPDTQFRLHANAHVMDHKVLWDAADFSEETKHYYERLAEISHRLKAPAYSLHAGVNSTVHITDVVDNMRRIQDIFGNIPVAIEGLYPGKRPNVMSTWEEYYYVYRCGLNVALDISHVNILHSHRSNLDFCKTMLREFISDPLTLELHLSGNDGSSDQHNIYNPDLLNYFAQIDLKNVHRNTVMFSEGNHLRRLTNANI